MSVIAKFRVFIAHSESDKKFVDQFCEVLKGAGIDDYYLAEAPEEFSPDRQLAEKIAQEIDGCDCVIAIITVRSIGSPWVSQEIGYAKRANKQIVQIVEVGLKNIGFISGNQYANFYGSEISQDIQKRVIPYLQQLKEKAPH